MQLTDHLNRITTSQAIFSRRQEFYWLWILATIAYGIGDILTTLTILDPDVAVTEANVLITTLVGQFGEPAFIVLKLGVFFGALAVSVSAAEYWDDRLLYYSPPLILTLVGIIVTLNNLHLVLIA